MASWPAWVTNPNIPPIWITDSSQAIALRLLNPGWMRRATALRHALDRRHRTQWAVP